MFIKRYNAFILYTEQKEIINELTDEDAGRLLKAIFAYAQNEKVNLQGALKLAFIPIRQQIDRNADKYKKTIEKRKESGTKGGRPKNENEISFDDLSDEEKEILLKFAKKAKAKTPLAYIKKLLSNGDFETILNEEFARIKKEELEELKEETREEVQTFTEEDEEKIKEAISHMKRTFNMKGAK